MARPTEVEWQEYHGAHALVRILQGLALLWALGSLVFGDPGRAFTLVVITFLLNLAKPLPPG